MYPGDVLHYYIQATDDAGRTSTLPADLSGFGNFASASPYDRSFVVRGLPSIKDETGAQPGILVINDDGHNGGEAAFTSAFAQIGYHEGVAYDTYTVRDPGGRESNGIGSAGGHGATAEQLVGYDGSDVSPNDKSDDIAVLEAWVNTSGVRNAAYFGDNIAHGLATYSARGAAYLAGTMGVEYLADDVRPTIESQVAPVVMPSDYGQDWFSSVFVASGGCPRYRSFDQIRPLPGSEVGHHFTGRCRERLR
jgi:hypothetical protein